MALQNTRTSNQTTDVKQKKIRGSYIHDAEKKGYVRVEAQPAFPVCQHHMSLVRVHEHILLSGRIGSGKSQALLPMIDMITALADQENSNTIAVITDPSGEFISQFYNPARDVILNPYDARTADWNPFNEVEITSDCDNLAASIIQPSGSKAGDEMSWVTYARNLFSDYIRVMKFSDDISKHSTSPKRVFELIAGQVSKEEIIELLGDAPSASMSAKKGNESYIASVESIAIQSLRYLRDLSDNGKFSIREFVRKAATGTGPRILWIPYSVKQRSALVRLIGAWLDLYVGEVLSLAPDRNRNAFLVCDELDSIGRIESLKAGLTMGRKFGLSCICAIQAVSQLRSTYGADDAATLMGSFASKVVLGQADMESAGYFSSLLGTYDDERTTAKTTTGRGTDTNEVNRLDTTREQVKEITETATSEDVAFDRGIRRVTETELLSLSTNTGYALLAGHMDTPDGLRILTFRLPVVEFVKISDRELVKGQARTTTADLLAEGDNAGWVQTGPKSLDQDLPLEEREQALSAGFSPNAIDLLDVFHRTAGTILFVSIEPQNPGSPAYAQMKGQRLYLAKRFYTTFDRMTRDPGTIQVTKETVTTTRQDERRAPLPRPMFEFGGMSKESQDSERVLRHAKDARVNALMLIAVGVAIAAVLYFLV